MRIAPADERLHPRRERGGEVVTLVEGALKLLEDYTKGRIRLAMPDLFWPKLGSILWTTVRVGRMSAKPAEDAIRCASDLNIPTVPAAALLPDAQSIAVQFDRTVCDAI